MLRQIISPYPDITLFPFASCYGRYIEQEKRGQRGKTKQRGGSGSGKQMPVSKSFTYASP
jgi:hypothetical protein